MRAVGGFDDSGLSVRFRDQRCYGNESAQCPYFASVRVIEEGGLLDKLKMRLAQARILVIAGRNFD